MGGAGVRSAVWHRHDGELDYHSDAAPNPGRQARPALGFAAPAWALSVGTGGLGHAYMISHTTTHALEQLAPLYSAGVVIYRRFCRVARCFHQYSVTVRHRGIGTEPMGTIL